MVRRESPSSGAALLQETQGEMAATAQRATGRQVYAMAGAAQESWRDLCQAPELTPARPACMDADALSTEQQYLLRRIHLEAQSMSREQLVDELLQAWEAKLRLKQYFASVVGAHGGGFQVVEGQTCRLPNSEKGLVEVFGHLPTDEEIAAYYEQQWETATMEVDMDEIVLTPDEDFG